MKEEPLETKLKRFEDICRGRGIRLTHQRIELFREIAMDKSHPSAEEIYVRIRLKMPTISLDTVYRTLSTFESFGLIGRLEALDDRARFDSNPRPHCHLVCHRCKEVKDLEWPEFEDAPLPPQTRGWGHIKSRHIEIRGFCGKCLKEDR
jgi:Fur family peroxide stress response transcriptional regulator